VKCAGKRAAFITIKYIFFSAIVCDQRLAEMLLRLFPSKTAYLPRAVFRKLCSVGYLEFHPEGKSHMRLF